MHYHAMEQALLTERDHRREAGRRLRQLIQALGMSYVEAAEIMGASKSGLGNWMRGKDAYPSPYGLYKLSRLKRIDFNWVFLADPSGLRKDLAEALLGLSPSLADQEEPERRGAERPKRQRVSTAKPAPSKSVPARKTARAG